MDSAELNPRVILRVFPNVAGKLVKLEYAIYYSASWHPVEKLIAAVGQWGDQRPPESAFGLSLPRPRGSSTTSRTYEGTVESDWAYFRVTG